MATSQYDSLIEQAANDLGVPAPLALAISKTGEKYDPRNPESPKGAYGPMQVMPATFNQMAAKLGIENPDRKNDVHNIYAGVAYLKEMLDRFQNPVLAVAAYNSGPGAVEKYGGIPPYKETQGYVSRIFQQPTSDSVQANPGEFRSRDLIQLEIPPTARSPYDPAPRPEPQREQFIPWDSIEKHPEYQSLPEDKQMEVKTGWFDKFIAPRSQFQNLKSEQQDIVKTNFFAGKRLPTAAQEAVQAPAVYADPTEMAAVALTGAGYGVIKAGARTLPEFAASEMFPNLWKEAAKGAAEWTLATGAGSAGAEAGGKAGRIVGGSGTIGDIGEFVGAALGGTLPLVGFAKMFDLFGKSPEKVKPEDVAPEFDAETAKLRKILEQPEQARPEQGPSQGGPKAGPSEQTRQGTNGNQQPGPEPPPEEPPPQGEATWSTRDSGMSFEDLVNKYRRRGMSDWQATEAMFRGEGGMAEAAKKHKSVRDWLREQQQKAADAERARQEAQYGQSKTGPSDKAQADQAKADFEAKMRAHEENMARMRQAAEQGGFTQSQPPPNGGPPPNAPAPPQTGPPSTPSAGPPAVPAEPTPQPVNPVVARAHELIAQGRARNAAIIQTLPLPEPIKQAMLVGQPYGGSNGQAIPMGGGVQPNRTLSAPGTNLPEPVHSIIQNAIMPNSGGPLNAIQAAPVGGPSAGTGQMPGAVPFQPATAEEGFRRLQSTTPEHLLSIRNHEGIGSAVTNLLGSEREFGLIDDGMLPGNKRWGIANKHAADLHHAAAQMDTIETGKILDRLKKTLTAKDYDNIPSEEELRKAESGVAVKKILPKQVAEKVFPPAMKGESGGGLKRDTYTPNGDKVETQFSLVNAKDLITSHDINGAVNSAYPAELQPRDRSRIASKAQILTMSLKINPDLLGDSAKISDGSPIIGQDNVVESGNARTLALKEAYRAGNGKTYKSWLVANAQRFGLNPADVMKLKEPVLVRTRLSDVPRAEFARQANQADIASMSPTELARSDAARITDDHISMLKIPENGNVFAGANLPFVKRFLEILGPQEAAQYYSKATGYTRQLSDRIQNAIFAKAYGDVSLLSLVAEEADPEIKNIINTLNIAAPEFAKIRSSKADASGLDITPNIVEAARLIQKARSEGVPLDRYLAQQNLFQPHDPTSVAVAKFFASNSRSAKKMGGGLRVMAEGVNKELGRIGNVELFPRAKETPDSIIGRALKRIGEIYGKEQKGSQLRIGEKVPPGSNAGGEHGPERRASSEDAGSGGPTVSEPQKGLLRRLADPLKSEKGAIRLPTKAEIDATYNRIKEFIDTFSTVPMKQQLKEARYKSFGDIARVSNFVGKLYDKLSVLPPDVRKDLFRYLDGQAFLSGARFNPQFAQDWQLMDPRVQRLGDRLMKLNDMIGMMLAKRGMMSQETFDRNRGQYVHYMYLRHVLGDESPLFSPSGKLDLSELKQRKNLTESQKKALGQIEDVAVAIPAGVSKALTDAHKWDYFQHLATNPAWAWQPRRIKFRSPQSKAVGLHGTWSYGDLADELEVMRLVNEKSPGVPEIQERIRRIERALSMTRPPPDIENWRVLEGKKWGPLNGVHIRKQIYRDIMPIFSQVTAEGMLPAFLNSLLGIEETAMTVFKAGKTALSPTTMIRNVMSNMVQMNWSGMPVHEVLGYVGKALKAYKDKSPAFRLAERHGAFKTNFTEAELGEVLDALRRAQGARGHLAQIAEFAKNVASYYGKIDDIFKLAKFIEQREMGKSAGQSVVEAQKWGMDYSLVHPFIKAARRHAFPFVTYAYKISPLALETAKKRPWIIAAYLMLPWIWNKYMAGRSDMNEEEWDKLLKQLPSHVRKTGSYFALPWKSPEGNFQWVDYSYFLPIGNQMQLEQSAQQGEVADIMKNIGFGNPIYNIVTGLTSMKGGVPKDPFSWQDIYNPLDPPWLKAAKFSEWLYLQFGPTAFSSKGPLGKTIHIGDKDKWGRTITPEQALLSWMGVNIYAPTKQQGAIEKKAKIKEYEAALIKVMTDPQISTQRKTEYYKTFNERVKEIQKSED